MLGGKLPLAVAVERLRGDHLLQSLLLLLSETAQILLDLSLRFVQREIERRRPDNMDLKLMTAAGLLIDSDIIEIVGTRLKGQYITFFEIQACERPTATDLESLRT